MLVGPTVYSTVIVLSRFNVLVFPNNLQPSSIMSCLLSKELHSSLSALLTVDCPAVYLFDGDISDKTMPTCGSVGCRRG